MWEYIILRFIEDLRNAEKTCCHDGHDNQGEEDLIYM